MHLRLYVTKLEMTSELYKLEKLENTQKDSLIFLKNLEISNQDSIIKENNTFIAFQDKQYQQITELNKNLKKSLKIQKTLTGAGVIITAVVCILLIK